MDKRFRFRKTKRIPAGLSTSSSEGKELEETIVWLEQSFKAKYPDDITKARIRRRLIQEWKARTLMNVVVLMLTVGGTVGVMPSLALMLAVKHKK